MSSGKIDVEPGPLGVVPPFQADGVSVGTVHLKSAPEGGMCIAETDQVPKDRTTGASIRSSIPPACSSDD